MRDWTTYVIHLRFTQKNVVLRHGCVCETTRHMSTLHQRAGGDDALAQSAEAIALSFS
jgi:hypothetical protein